MRPGARVEGRFLIESEAGSGGMGVVYRAHDEVTGSAVALKILHLEGAHDAARFLREARILSELAHPRIVQYVAHGKLESGAPYLAMQWLDGEDLAKILRIRNLTIDESLTLVLRAAEALSEAHRRGLVHRDIKPSNLFLVDGLIERVTILDFGIARATDDATYLTGTGMAVGTPAYMAPEQVRGLRSIDARADVFALGCVLFECLCGSPPFVSEYGAPVLAKILVDEAPRISRLRPDASADLDAMVARMLTKDPTLRPRDAGAVALAISTLFQATRREAVSVPSRPSDALTTGERRVISVVLIVPANSDPKSVAAARLRIERVVEGSIGLPADRVGVLDDGTFIVAISGGGGAAEQAAIAARCALELRVGLPNAAIAVATGRGVVAAGSARGEVLERARRALERIQKSRDEPTQIGEIRVDSATATLVNQKYQLVADGADFVLSGELEGESGQRLLLGKAVSCVGRERDLALLEGVFAECVSESVARAVVLIAPAGFGKTRIVTELIRRLEKRGEEFTLFRGSADVVGVGSPFGLIGRAIRGSLGIADEASADERRTKLSAAIARDVPAEHAPRIAQFIGELAAIPFPDESSDALRAARADAVLMGNAMREAWEDWLAARASSAPILLLLEDLHWGDVPSVKFLDAALRHLSDQPLIVLATARPEVDRIFPDLWAERGAERVKIGALTSRACQRLAREALGASADPKIVEQIVERSEGNPFFLEELVRAVAAGDRNLPESVAAALEARLDAVGQHAKRLLRAASIFGRRFWTSGLEALLGQHELPERIATVLESLELLELIARQKTSTIAACSEYEFRHALLRDAAYDMLTDEDRATGHRLAGEWLESVGIVDAMTLAEHFERGRALDRALRWFHRASVQALEGNDLNAVLERTAHAERCSPDDVTLGALRQLQSDAQYLLGSLDVAERLAIQAAELVAPGSAGWFRALGSGITAAGQQGGNDRVEALLERAVGAEARGDAAGAERGTAVGEQIVCISRGITQLLAAGRSAPAAKAIARLDQLRCSQAASDPRAFIWTERVHATGDVFANRHEKALERLNRIISACAEVGDAAQGCQNRIVLGSVYAYLGELNHAEDVLRQAIASAERLGTAYLAGWARYGLGKVFALGGDLEKARPLLQGVLATLAKSARIVSGAHVYLSMAAHHASDFTLAEREARAALDMTLSAPMRAAALAALARAELATETAPSALVTASPGAAASPRNRALAGALEHADEASKILATQQQSDEFSPLVRLAHVETLAASGNLDAARSAARLARDALHENAARIRDPARRDAFLARIRVHALTLAKAAELGVE